MDSELSDLIDLIYSNEEVEGVAVTSITGDTIIENQLTITDNSLQTISTTVERIKTGLIGAKRKLNGFLFRSENTILQVCVFSEYMIFVQLNESGSASKVEKSIRSIFGQYRERSQVSAPEENREVAGQETQAEEVSEEPPADHINLEDFASKLKNLLKRVAPGGVAEKMINAGFTEAKIDIASMKTIAKSDAIALGESVIGKIPNASRRKIILKEYETITSSL